MSFCAPHHLLLLCGSLSCLDGVLVLRSTLTLPLRVCYWTEEPPPPLPATTFQLEFFHVNYNNVFFVGYWRWMVRETISEFLLPSSQNTLNFTNPHRSSSPVNLTISSAPPQLQFNVYPLHWQQGSVTDHHTRILTKPTGMHMSIVSRVVFVGILQTQGGNNKNLFFGPNLVYHHHRSSFFRWIRTSVKQGQ